MLDVLGHVFLVSLGVNLAGVAKVAVETHLDLQLGPRRVEQDRVDFFFLDVCFPDLADNLSEAFLVKSS